MKLDKKINAFQLSMITIGMAISGQFFGWNYALQYATLTNVLIATVIIGIFYLCFIFCCAELATTMPDAGGPYAFVTKAFGEFAGYLTGIAVLCEYGFGIPAIAVSIGSYLHYLNHNISGHMAATGFTLLFMFSNLLGTCGIVVIETMATLVALACLFIFYIIGFHHLPTNAIWQIPTHASLSQISMAIPFLLWIFLAVEGGALAAEEVTSPEKNIGKGLCAGIIILFTASLFTVFFIGYFTNHIHRAVDYPFAAIMGEFYGRDSLMTIGVSIMSLFGLMAALNGLIMGCSREVFALSRAGHLPQFLSRLSNKHAPTYAIITPCLFAIICAYSANLANALVTLSVLGALFMYIFTTFAHIKLRISNCTLSSPFKAWFPFAPTISLLIGVWCITCILRYTILKEYLIILNWHVSIMIIAGVILFLSTVVYHQRNSLLRFKLRNLK